MSETSVYVADLELQGVLMFSTEQKPSLAEEGGALISSGHFIHNYPLIYGFAQRSVESYAIIPSLHYLSYEELEESRFTPKLAKKPLHYGFVEEQIRSFLDGGGGIYIFPAFPLRVFVKKLFMAARGTGYAEFRGALKTVFPRIVHYIAIVPPSLFRTVVLAKNVHLPEDMYIRIGMKRMGILRVRLRRADIVGREGAATWSSIPVNLHDVEIHFKYTVEDFLRVLETRSKPPGKPKVSLIGYIKARNLFRVACDNIEYRLPLPSKLFRY